jgi:hypothetical protein
VYIVHLDLGNRQIKLPGQTIDRSILQAECVKLFRAAIKIPETRDPYERRLINFLTYVKLSPDDSVTLSRNKP